MPLYDVSVNVGVEIFILAPLLAVMPRPSVVMVALSVLSPAMEMLPPSELIAVLDRLLVTLPLASMTATPLVISLSYIPLTLMSPPSANIPAEYVPLTCITVEPQQLTVPPAE